MPEDITTKEKENIKVFSEEKDLTVQQKKDFTFVKDRIEQLQESRQFQYGKDLENIWLDADKDYIPHRLTNKGRKVIATDEEKGWRGSIVTLGSTNWQTDIAQNNPYIKIQTALATLIDRNPTGVFLPAGKKFQSTTPLIQQLYQRNWEIAKSKQQLKLFVFNLAKYGWAIARTFPLKITRKVKVLKDYNEDKPEDSVYDEKEITEYNDVFRENLDPWNAWIDDMTRPGNYLTTRDWCWRKVYAMDTAKEEFGKYKNWKYVKAGGITEEKITGKTQQSKKYKEKDLVEILFYENRLRDLFMVIANGIPVIIEPLQISDSSGNKKLSCWHTLWTFRSAECPYGIGVYEALRNDNAMLDRISNMTVDQLILSIYKMGFYQGTERLTETGQMQVSPGVLKQALDPKNINWMNVPGPGNEAWTGIELFQKRVDNSSGITPILEGEVTGKTAFEIAQAKESALKRLKIPLDNICDALEQEGYITISLMDLIYSIPETYAISDPAMIEAYMQEIQSDPELYEDKGVTQEGKRNIEAKVFREFPLNLEEDEEGNLTETNETRFFRVKPKRLKWEGVINIKPQSILTPSKELDKALEMEMYNMLIPLFGQDPMLYTKAAKNICKLYDKDPKDVLPDLWLQPPMIEEQPLMVPINQAMKQEQQVQGMAQQAMSQQGPGQAQKVTGQVTMPQQPQGVIGKLISKISQGFRKI